MMNNHIAITSYKHIPLVHNPIIEIAQIIGSNTMNSVVIPNPYQVALQKDWPVYKARRNVLVHLLVPNPANA